MIGRSRSASLRQPRDAMKARGIPFRAKTRYDLGIATAADRATHRPSEALETSIEYGRTECERHDPKTLRQVLRLPDERLRFPSYGGPAPLRGLRRDRDAGRRRPDHPQHLP